MNNPASQESLSKIKKLSNKRINLCTNTLLNNILFYNKDTNNELLKTILQLNNIVLYINIELSILIKAHFNVCNNLEKRLSLRHITIALSETFKSLFKYKEGRNLWNEIDSFKCYFSKGQYELYTQINERVKSFEINNESLKDMRNIAVHYDYNTCKFYDFLIDVNEEVLFQKINALFQIIDLITKFINLYLSNYCQRNHIANNYEITISDFDNLFATLSRINTLPARDAKYMSIIQDSLLSYSTYIESFIHYFKIINEINRKYNLQKDMLQRSIIILNSSIHIFCIYGYGIFDGKIYDFRVLYRKTILFKKFDNNNL